MFKHSTKVPRLYKISAKIAKDVKEGIGSIKSLVYENRKKHPNIKAMYALVTTVFQKHDEIENLLKKSQFFTKEPRADPWLTKILLVELLWGKKRIAGDSVPEKTVQAYEQIFKAHMTNNTPISLKESDTQELTMAEGSDVVADNAPLLPPHTKQAARAISLLLFFSVLMFSLPFGSFFGVKYLLKDHYHVVGFANTIWSVTAAVISVNLIIVVYAYIAFYEPEYDSEGNLIKKSNSKSNLNLKQE